MYRPDYYREDRQSEIFRLMETHSFAILISHTTAEGVLATHVPLLFEIDSTGTVTLTGHLARRNPQWQALSDGDEVLAVFSGPSSYISPQWYTSDSDVPTWNYEAVHAYGRWKRVDDSGATRELLQRTVAHYERDFLQPWQLESVPAPIVDGLQKGVVAFTIAVSNLQGIRKLGQDKQPHDVRGVIEGLRGQGRAEGLAVATAMALACQKDD